MHCPLPFLRIGWGAVGGHAESRGGGEGVGTCIGMYNEKSTLFSFSKKLNKRKKCIIDHTFYFIKSFYNVEMCLIV